MESSSALSSEEVKLETPESEGEFSHAAALHRPLTTLSEEAGDAQSCEVCLSDAVATSPTLAGGAALRTPRLTLTSAESLKGLTLPDSPGRARGESITDGTKMSVGGDL